MGPRTDHQEQDDRRSRRTRRTLIVLLLSFSMVAATGTAYAFWTTSGGGTATGDAATSASSVTVTQVGTIDGLVPGGTPKNISFKITNPTTAPLYINNVTVTVASVSGAGTGGLGCTVSDFVVASGTKSIAADQPQGDTVYTASGPTVAMVNKATNQDDCKSATVHLAFAAA